MGVSIEQYRAAIGLFMISRGCKMQPLLEHDFDYDETGHDINWSQPTGRVTSTSWKLNAILLVTLVTTILAKSCMEDLLLISGIEPNPGPITETAEQKAARLKKQQDKCDEYNRIIAELVTKAPNEQIKNCLRLYNPENNLKKHHRAFNARVKDVLVETLDFLGFPGKEEYDKETVVHDMVCAIQNYLPDTCRICKDEYRTKLGETPLLKCCKCGQGVHNDCFKKLLGIPDDDGNIEITAENVMKTIDPTKLQGLHYFCGGCEKLIIPSPEDGKLRKHLTNDDKEPPATVLHDNEKDKDQTQENDEVETADEIDKQEKTVPACTCNKTANTKTNVVSEEVAVCKFYRQNKCRHKNPKECKFRHPRPCKKLILHGTNEQRGCTMGRKCSEYHPIMCRDSLTKGICLNESCRKSHIRGTKRTPELACKQSVTEGICLDENCKLTHLKGTRRTMDPDKRVSFQNESKSQNSTSFLEELRSLKGDLLREVDKMITLRLGYPQLQTPTYADILKNKTENTNLIPGSFRLVQDQSSPEGILKLVQAH